jgi:TonB family protein
MAAKKPYEQFGPYILFKKLESDSLGDLYRAARIEERTLGPMIALHRLTGGHRSALSDAAMAARPITAVLNGTSFVREQSIDVVDGIPIIAHDYAGGRSLRHIVSRARGGNGTNPNPIPIDQAIAITERVALSLATTSELRYGGERLSHGALVPHFIWITDDGEIRVAGQQLGKGLLASLSDQKVAQEIGRYFAPEYQHSKEASKASEVYALGAILYLVVTGHEPPDPMSTSAFMNTLRAAKTMAGPAIPDDIRKVIERSLTLDPGLRFQTTADMRQALVALSSTYSSTTFNLAFYLSNLLKKEMEAEAAEREKESKVNIAPYLEAPAAAAAATAGGAGTAARKNRVPIAIAAGLGLAIIAGAAYFTLGARESNVAPPTATLASAIPTPPPARQVVIPEPLVASPSGSTATAATDTAATTDTAMDEAARKKAFEEAVRQKLNEEMMKLQTEYNRQLQRQTQRSTPMLSSASVTAPTTEARSTSGDEDPGPSAAQLDQQRRETLLSQPAVTNTQAFTPSVAQTQTVAPNPVPQPAAVTQTQPAAPALQPPVNAPAQASTREGDLIDYASLDIAPTVVRAARPVYPPIAARQRIETTVMLTILVSENGDVADVKVLRGDPRFGFNESAMQAMRRAKYTPPMKDGKRVKTWLPQMIQFKP